MAQSPSPPPNTIRVNDRIISIVCDRSRRTGSCRIRFLFIIYFPDFPKEKEIIVPMSHGNLYTMVAQNMLCTREGHLINYRHVHTYFWVTISIPWLINKRFEWSCYQLYVNKCLKEVKSALKLNIDPSTRDSKWENILFTIHALSQWPKAKGCLVFSRQLF